MKEIILNFLTTQEGIALTSLIVGWLITSPIDLLRKLAKKTETTVDDVVMSKVDEKKIADKAAKEIQKIAETQAKKKK